MDKPMKATILTGRTLGIRSEMIYGHFIEHFHRLIYGGLYEPGNPLSDEMGFRQDVLLALKAIGTPVLRWPGGCFTSSYHWKDGVGEKRTPAFDKAWRVEESNAFGTDEFMALCEKLSCAPYICANAGTGTPEEMSDWVEYCNLQGAGQYARLRAQNGHPKPYGVPYWSIGNENYGAWEIGAKSPEEWGRYVAEAAKMMLRADPTIELSAAALNDIDWNVNLLKRCGQYLNWISIHAYWDGIHQTNDFAAYEQCMAYTAHLTDGIDGTRGLLTAMGLEKKIKIAFDEWNLRGWYHPNSHTTRAAARKEDYLTPRDDNDINRCYTMADTVFTACFLNALNRNCDIVGMANYAPVVNGRGLLYAHPGGIVKRGTYHVFDLYANDMGERVLDAMLEDVPELTVTDKQGREVRIPALDMVATYKTADGCYAVAVVNLDPVKAHDLTLDFLGAHRSRMRLSTVTGPRTDAYNDVDREEITLSRGTFGEAPETLTIPPHSVCVAQIK